MTEPTTAEKCRVVAERWGLLRPRQAESIETCDWGDCWSETVAERSSGVGWLSVCDVHALIDIPNDPVAANALWDALEADGYHLRLFGGRSNHFVRLLLPYQNASWHGRSENRWTALLEAAYQAALAEKQP